MMDKYITDERTGLKYELVGDYYLIAGDDEPEENQPIGIWGQRHLRYLKKHRRVRYANLLTSGELNAYLADIDRQAENGSAESQRPNGMGRADVFLPRPCIRNCLSSSNLYIRQGPSYQVKKMIRRASFCLLRFQKSGF